MVAEGRTGTEPRQHSRVVQRIVRLPVGRQALGRNPPLRRGTAQRCQPSCSFQYHAQLQGMQHLCSITIDAIPRGLSGSFRLRGLFESNRSYFACLAWTIEKKATKQIDTRAIYELLGNYFARRHLGIVCETTLLHVGYGRSIPDEHLSSALNGPSLVLTHIVSIA